MATHKKEIIILVQPTDAQATDFAKLIQKIVDEHLVKTDCMDVFTQFTAASDGRQTCNITVLTKPLPAKANG